MEIRVNNQLKSFSNTSLTVQQLLDLEMPEKQKGIAIAISNKVIPKVEWDKTAISENDDVLIIKATQGG
jgi:sulfur carrier protein